MLLSRGAQLTSVRFPELRRWAEAQGVKAKAPHLLPSSASRAEMVGWSWLPAVPEGRSLFQSLVDMAPKYILEQFLQQELLINITEHEVGAPGIPTQTEGGCKGCGRQSCGACPRVGRRRGCIPGDWALPLRGELLWWWNRAGLPRCGPGGGGSTWELARNADPQACLA